MVTVNRGRGRGRPKKKKSEPEDDLIGALPGQNEDEEIVLDVAENMIGVSSSWLAMMFGHDKNYMKRKIAKAGLEPVGSRYGAPIYSLKEAAAYLVKPKVDLVEFIKSLRPNDLPPMLNDAYWSAMLKRQKWEENARDLWRTEDVLEVLGDTNFSIRNTVNLWVEEVDRLHGLTNEQRETLLRMQDRLLTMIYEELVSKPSQRKTRALSKEMELTPEKANDPQPED